MRRHVSEPSLEAKRLPRGVGGGAGYDSKPRSGGGGLIRAGGDSDGSGDEKRGASASLPRGDGPIVEVRRVEEGCGEGSKEVVVKGRRRWWW